MIDPKLVHLIAEHENAKLWRGAPGAGDPHFDLTGAKLRLAVEMPERHGTLTAGFGFNLEVRRSRRFWLAILEGLIGLAIGSAQRYPWFAELNGPRQAAVVSMIYQMGGRSFAGFRITIAHLAQGRYQAAAAEMMRSAWARNHRRRARELRAMMARGEWPDWVTGAPP